VSAGIVLRRATSDDVTAVARLEQQLFGSDAWSATGVLEELTGPRRRAVVACDAAGRVVGYAVTMSSGEVVDLQRIGVVAAHRRTGVAGALLAELTERAAADGADRMLLEVSADNQAASAFYAAHGFEQVDVRTRYYRDGSDALVLRAPLARSGGGAVGGSVGRSGGKVP
jgi:ribosomal-protein-alanine acetyltransferase